MLRDFTAEGNVRPGRIDVGWRWSGTNSRPALRLVRRRRSFPATADDGASLVDFRQLFREEELPWSWIGGVRYLVDNSVAESGMVQAEVRFFHGDPDESPPLRVDVSWYDSAMGTMRTDRVEDVTRVELSLPDPGPWGQVEELEIFHAPEGDPESSAGVIRILRDHSDGESPSLFRWNPDASGEEEVPFDSGRVVQTYVDAAQIEEREVTASWPRIRRLDGTDLATALSLPHGLHAEAREEEVRVELEERFSEDTGDWTRWVRVADFGAVPEETSYYSVFEYHPSTGTDWTTDREWRAQARATRGFGFPGRLYGLLPALHQHHDEPTQKLRGQGQLRRFLEVFGVGLDHVRSEVESLETRHDLHTVKGDALPALGEWVGWAVDRTTSLHHQRTEVRLAPKVYRTVGSLPNLTALVSRATGWRCEAKEFVHNLFLTNAPQALPLRELRERVQVDDGFQETTSWTRSHWFDGRPSAVVDDSGRSWLFWHSNRRGRWEIFHRVQDGSDEGSDLPLEEVPEGRPAPTHSDLAPSTLWVDGDDGEEIWLVWASDREGAWDLWYRIHTADGWGTPLRLTDHPAPDRHPTLVTGPDDELRVYWESLRRGNSEVWERVRTSSGWGPPMRVTDPPNPGDREPTAALDPEGGIRLAWRREEGDRSRLYTALLENGDWSSATPLEDGPQRDEAPFLIHQDGELRLFWHSDRTGRWEIWTRTFDGVEWDDPVQVTQSPDAQKEPTAVLDGPRIRLFYRFEKADPEKRSRTVDVTDRSLLEGMGELEDRIHYTYDIRRRNENHYARDTVGLYLSPPDSSGPAPDPASVVERARSYVEPFRPAPVRLVWIPEVDEGPEDDEVVDGTDDGPPVPEPLVDEFEDELE